MKRDLWAYTGMIAVAGAAAWISFDSLRGLGRLAGIHPAWLLPLAIDAYALTATRLWMRGDATDQVRRWAMCNAFAAIAVSIVGNGAYHGFTSAGIHTLGPAGRGWIIAVAVAAVAPAALYAVAHLWSLVSKDQRTSNGAGPATDPAPAHAEPQARTLTPAGSQPSAPPARARTRVERAGAGSPKRSTTSRAGEMRDYAHAELAAGREVTGGELDRKFGTRDYGRVVLRQVRAERNGHELAGVPS